MTNSNTDVSEIGEIKSDEQGTNFGISTQTDITGSQTTFISELSLDRLPDKEQNAFGKALDTSYCFTDSDINFIGCQLAKSFHDNIVFKEVKVESAENGVTRIDLKETLGEDISTTLIAQRKKVVSIYNTGSNHWFGYVMFTVEGDEKLYVRYKDSLNKEYNDFVEDLASALPNANIDIEKVGNIAEQVLEFEHKTAMGPYEHVNCGVFALRNMQVLANISNEDLLRNGKGILFFMHNNDEEGVDTEGIYRKTLAEQRITLAEAYYANFDPYIQARASNEEEVRELIIEYLNPDWLKGNPRGPILPSKVEKDRDDSNGVNGVSGTQEEKESDYDNLGSYDIKRAQLRGKADRVEFYNANTTAEVGHPNADGRLLGIITEVLREPGITTLEDFHTKVYELFWESNRSQQQKYIYEFRYKVTYKSRLVEVGSSDDLLLWLIANGQHNEIKLIIERYNPDIAAIKDNKGNNILHIAAFYGADQLVSDIFAQLVSFPYQLADLINHRNNDGTNPLGMAFLGRLSYEKLSAITRTFILEELFKVNDYLNNRKGVDVLDSGFLQQVGGFNVLHIALFNKYPAILQALDERHKLGTQSDLDPYYVNFSYPCLNPAYHMYSPGKLVKEVPPTKQGMRNEQYVMCQELLARYQSEQRTRDDEDSSGDSEDENSSAYVWKHVLMDMIKSEEITRCEEVLIVPLFHGVPLMSGLYTHSDRKYIGRKLMLLNPGVTEETKNIIRKQLGEDKNPIDELKAIHSRTSTASAGMENLAKVAKAGDDTLDRLSVIDNRLKTGLQVAFQQNKTVFSNQVISFVNSYSSNETHRKVWKNLEKINRELNDADEIVKYRFPFISTSKTPDHGIKYGFGINLELPRGEGKLEPQYQDGRPKHRLAGFLYVIREKAGTFQEKLEGGELFDVCDLERVKDRYKNQLEVLYLGGIAKENILAVIPLIYPNFSREFDQSYHLTILSFTGKNYNRAKSDFTSNLEVEEDGSLILTQQTKSHRGQPNTKSACLANIFAQVADKIISKLSGGILITKLPNQQGLAKYRLDIPYKLSSNDFTTPNHKMLAKSKSKKSPSPELVKPTKLFSDELPEQEDDNSAIEQEENNTDNYGIEEEENDIDDVKASTETTALLPSAHTENVRELSTAQVISQLVEHDNRDIEEAVAPGVLGTTETGNVQ